MHRGGISAAANGHGGPPGLGPSLADATSGLDLDPSSSGAAGRTRIAQLLAERRKSSHGTPRSAATGGQHPLALWGTDTGNDDVAPARAPQLSRSSTFGGSQSEAISQTAMHAGGGRALTKGLSVHSISEIGPADGGSFSLSPSPGAGNRTPVFGSGRPPPQGHSPDDSDDSAAPPPRRGPTSPPRASAHHGPHGPLPHPSQRREVASPSASARALLGGTAGAVGAVHPSHGVARLTAEEQREMMESMGQSPVKTARGGIKAHRKPRAEVIPPPKTWLPGLPVRRIMLVVITALLLAGVGMFTRDVITLYAAKTRELAAGRGRHGARASPLAVAGYAVGTAVRRAAAGVAGALGGAWGGDDDDDNGDDGGGGLAGKKAKRRERAERAAAKKAARGGGAAAAVAAPQKTRGNRSAKAGGGGKPSGNGTAGATGGGVHTPGSVGSHGHAAAAHHSGLKWHHAASHAPAAAAAADEGVGVKPKAKGKEESALAAAKGGKGDSGGGGGDSDSGDDDTWVEFGGRLVAGLLAVALIVIPWVLYFYIDQLPIGRGQDKMSKKLSYWIDYLFSTSAMAKPVFLLILTVFMIVVGGLALFASSDTNIGDAVWETIAGIGIDWTFAGATEEGGFLVRLLAVMTSIGGMLITALMMGLVSDGIASKMDDLKKGKSDVLENQHTLILGWNDKVMPIIKQICLANESSNGGTIVVLSEREKGDMEDSINDYEGEFNSGRTKIICRQGSPMVVEQLLHVSVSTARSIIIVGGGTYVAQGNNPDPNDLDARLLLVLLSLLCIKEKHNLAGYIVAEMADLDNEPLVKMVGGDLIETVVSHDIIGRMMLQCARQPSLSLVWEDLLGFEGCEFYMKEWPAMTGMTFGQILMTFRDAVPLGIFTADGDEIVMNPPDSMPLEEGDQILVLAEDDDKYAPEPYPDISDPNVLLPRRRLKHVPEKILFCGWRRDMGDMIAVLDELVLAGSTLFIISPVSVDEREKMLAEDAVTDFKNLELVHVVGDPVCRKDLQQLPLDECSAVIVMAAVGTGETSEQTVSSMDSRSLATLLLIRDITRKKSNKRSGRVESNWVEELSKREKEDDEMRMISEILDMRTRVVISETRVADYVLSNELVSKALAMISEDRTVSAVLAELFSPNGNELFAHSAKFYTKPGEVLSFFDVAARCRQRREILVGYQRLSGKGVENEPKDERPLLNPPEKLSKREWSHLDLLVVVARGNHDDPEEGFDVEPPRVARNAAKRTGS